ncbi:sulfotransferase family protein [Zhongshania aquimaris]|uniref:Sulfotransferase n=1 Tax=Zhongshania aquimaris TaxID=2857107 RepID=A0ABS6VRC9_9GAMM|nr:sulfotransferase [Zhongshania aquimaris]MBW2940875.1 sulfotransferase [Zhongshania aquimaris]
MGRVTDFFVVGAPKSGTTSLYFYLKQHPQIFLPSKKELHYFSFPELKQRESGPGDKYVLRSCIETVEEYLEHYKGSDGLQCGDISPSYLFHSGSALRIKEFNPSAKIIILLRNHAEKAFSQYSHLRGVGREALGFKEALLAEDERDKAGYSDFWLYKKSTLYAPCVENYLDIFGAESVRVYLFDDLVNDRKKVLTEVCGFLGVDSSFHFLSEDAHNVSGKPRSYFVAKYILAPNLFTSFLRRIIPSSVGAPIRSFIKGFNTGGKEKMCPVVRDELYDLFAEDRLELESILKRKLPW